MFKSPAIAHHPLGPHLVNRFRRIHPHRREFVRSATASSSSSAPQLVVDGQPDRLPLEAASLRRIRLANHRVERAVLTINSWLHDRKCTADALECYRSRSTNRAQEESQKAAKVLQAVYLRIKQFYADGEAFNSGLAAYRTAAGVAGPVVKALEAFWRADTDLKKARAELNRARAQGAKPEDEALKLEQVDRCKTTRIARREEYRVANQKYLGETTGMIVHTPGRPPLRAAENIKPGDYEWMLRVIDNEILKFYERCLEEAKKQVASFAAESPYGLCEPTRMGTPAVPIEQSRDERREQPAETKDEAEQFDEVENIRKRPGPTEEYEEAGAENFKEVSRLKTKECEDGLEGLRVLKQSNVPLHPAVRLDGSRETTTSIESSQIKQGLVAHYPAALFPHKVNTAIVETVRTLLQESCYSFALRHMPGYVAEKNWDSPEVVELSSWQRTFKQILLKGPDASSAAFNTTLGMSQAQRRGYVLDKLEILLFVRNLAAHPRPMGTGGLVSLFDRVQRFAKLVGDQRLHSYVQRLASETTHVLKALRDRRLKNLEEGRTHKLYRQIVAGKTALERIREYQASMSQQHQAMCAAFEKEIQQLMDALPIAIQADEEAMFEEELPRLMEMVETMAKEAKLRAARTQLNIRAKRKWRSDKLLKEAKALVDKHAVWKGNGWFPFLKLSAGERESLFGGSPLAAGEQTGPQEVIESREQEHEMAGEEELSSPNNNRLSISQRANMRSALARALREEERESRRERAKADVDDAEAIITPTEKQLSRLQQLLSQPREEQPLNEKITNKYKRSDMNPHGSRIPKSAGGFLEMQGPDGSRMTISGFLEMLERKENAWLEDVKARAKKEKETAAVVEAAKAERQEERERKEAQVEVEVGVERAGEEDGHSSNTTISSNMDTTGALLADIASKKQAAALKEEEYRNQTRGISKEITRLHKVRVTLRSQMDKLDREMAAKQRRLEAEAEAESDNKTSTTAANPSTTTNNDDEAQPLWKKMTKLSATDKKLEDKITRLTKKVKQIRNSYSSEIMGGAIYQDQDQGQGQGPPAPAASASASHILLPASRASGYFQRKEKENENEEENKEKKKNEEEEVTTTTTTTTTTTEPEHSRRFRIRRCPGTSRRKMMTPEAAVAVTVAVEAQAARIYASKSKGKNKVRGGSGKGIKTKTTDGEVDGDGEDDLDVNSAIIGLMKHTDVDVKAVSDIMKRNEAAAGGGGVLGGSIFRLDDGKETVVLGGIGRRRVRGEEKFW